MAKSTKQVLLFKTWQISHTGWNCFQTDQSTTQNRHLIQNDAKFQWTISILLNRGFHAFVLTKSPLSLFNTYLVHTWLPPYQFPMITSFYYHNTFFSWRKFWDVTSRNVHGIHFCDQLLQRMTTYLWHFLVGALLIH